MNKLLIDAVIDENIVSTELLYGHMYFIYSSIQGIQENLFNINAESISFINSFFHSAIKVPNYVNKNKITHGKNNILQRQFNLPLLKISAIDLYNQIIYVILNEFLQKDIVVIETTGLSNLSINNLVKFGNIFLNHNKTKTIIIIHIEHNGVVFPKFGIEELDETKIEGFNNWITQLGK